MNLQGRMMRFGDDPSTFLSPGPKIPAKKLAAPKFRGQQGDKDEKVKIIKYLFTTSY